MESVSDLDERLAKEEHLRIINGAKEFNELGHGGEKNYLGILEDWFKMVVSDEVNGVTSDEGGAGGVFEAIVDGFGGDVVFREVAEEEVIIGGGHDGVKVVFVGEGAGFGRFDVDNLG